MEHMHILQNSKHGNRSHFTAIITQRTIQNISRKLAYKEKLFALTAKLVYTIR